MGTQIGMAFNKKLGAGFFGGEGFILQRLNGDGMAFIHAGGMVVRKELKGEKLLVDTGCLVAFTNQINYSIERAGNLKSMVFGGEGLFLATLQGHGTVWLQSLPFGRMAAPSSVPAVVVKNKAAHSADSLAFFLSKNHPPPHHRLHPPGEVASSKERYQ